MDNRLYLHVDKTMEYIKDNFNCERGNTNLISSIINYFIEHGSQSLTGISHNNSHYYYPSYLDSILDILNDSYYDMSVEELIDNGCLTLC